MKLVADIGNSSIKLVLYNDRDKDSNTDKEKLCQTVIQNDSEVLGSEIGNFLSSSYITHTEVSAVIVCCVSEFMLGNFLQECKKLFEVKPFVLQPKELTAFKHNYKTIETLGADRMAAAAGAVKLFPGKNVIIADFGTAVTIDAVSKEGYFLGGTIFPGIGAVLDAFKRKTPALNIPEISNPGKICGDTTSSSLQSGIYYSTIGAVLEVVSQLKYECFGAEDAVLITCGGNSYLYENAGIFDQNIDDLVLIGAYELYKQTMDSGRI